MIYLCDIIITSSNVTAHFAGALGKKTYLILPFKPFWYWGHENNSLWYPNIKILRQTKPGDWNDPLLQLNKELKKEL